MTIHQSIIMISSLVSATSFAGTAKFMGQGHVSRPAEYVEVAVQVKSECFRDLSAARNSANDAAQKVLALFKTIIDPNNPKDAAYTNGGSVSKHSGHYVNETRQLVCADTYEKTIKITLLTTNLQDFEENFLKIENEVYASLSGGTPSTETPVTYGVHSAPVAHLFSETVVEVERLALVEAVKNAKFEFGILMEAGCGVSSYQIASANEPSNLENIPNPYAGTRGVPPQNNPGGAPVVFADIWITKALEVVFDFQGGVCSDGRDLLGSNR